MLIYLGFGLGTAIYALNPAHSSSLTITYSKVRTYVLQSTALMYRWCVVAACIDRYVLSSANIRLRNLANVHVVRRVIPMIIIVWLVLPVHNLIFYTGNPTGYSTPSVIAVLYYHSIFSVTFGCILPASIMITCAFLIHHNLVLKQKRRQLIVIQQKRIYIEKIEQDRKRDREVFMILMTQVIIFIITATPLTIYWFYNAATISITNKSTERLVIEQFAYFWVELIGFLFPVSSFYLYTLTSSMFRGELVNMIRSVLPRKCLRTTARVAPVTNSIEDRTVPQQHIALALVSLSHSPNSKAVRQANEIIRQEQNFDEHN
jgi:hypothetical protein